METDLPQSLYDQDLYAWTGQQAEALRRAQAAGIDADVDWENVAEELDALGRSELDAVESHLETVIEHLLKLIHSPATDPRADWRVSVRKARGHLRRKMSKTLWRKAVEDFAKIYSTGRGIACDGLARDKVKPADLPETCPWTLEQLLDDGFWPDGTED